MNFSLTQPSITPASSSLQSNPSNPRSNPLKPISAKTTQLYKTKVRNPRPNPNNLQNHVLHPSHRPRPHRRQAHARDCRARPRLLPKRQPARPPLLPVGRQCHGEAQRFAKFDCV
ncbi:hypothetical protein L484_007109 [Morus notabilis]|uniref:Uncharacterized protein n=1 Tax=Morus notabilis TaxID=981085 RepID=W9SG33_9ROSA|nr:hypothetical protein L484_007109 [Morus notabilis]